jgi:hypothetical protein
VGELKGLEMSDSFELRKVKKVKGAWEPKGDTAPADLSIIVL